MTRMDLAGNVAPKKAPAPGTPGFNPLTDQVALLHTIVIIRFEQAVGRADRALTYFMRVLRGRAGFLLWQVDGSIVEGCKGTAKDRKADHEEHEASERGTFFW